MKKTIFYFLLGFLLLTSTILFSQAKQPSRPNIIFIMSDDHAYQAISAYDKRLISTPNIDKIAKNGVLFTNASVTNSICAPSRATILTGKHSHLNGKVDNHFSFDTSNVTFPGNETVVNETQCAVVFSDGGGRRSRAKRPSLLV